MSLLFILDRRTGKPIFGVEERPVPKGDVPGEWYSPTQPFPLKPPPLARTTMTKDDVSRRTPETEKFCGEWLSRLRTGGLYTPFGLTPSLSMPGTMGGGNWGGVSFDPHLGYIFVNTSSLGTAGQMAATEPGAPLPFHNLGGYTRFLDQDGYPCQQPPWGEMSAINANTGEIVWRKPLGNYDELEAQGLKNTGAPNIGGSIATAGGLVFIAATTDSKFRAFDSRTGEERWVTRLDASGTTVPITYLGSDGKQYVVVAAGGSNRFRMIAHSGDSISDSLIAFALSDKPAPATATGSVAPTTTHSVPAPLKTGAMGDLPEGTGKDTVIALCTKCHGPSNFSTLRMSRRAWEAEVAGMKDKGATGTDEEFQRVVEYLSKNFASQ
jgi:glucose dehydrogenase